MPDKTKQGLGLVAIAALALLIAFVVAQGGGAASDVVVALAKVTALVCGIVGLALVAVGLLRE